jgi:hypothetical protein
MPAAIPARASNARLLVDALISLLSFATDGWGIGRWRET